MNKNLLLDFSVDRENKKIKVKREFEAPVADVWAAWTQQELLDQWWAPKPWKARTKSMDFKNGGTWLYAMVGPDGSEHWARADFSNITLMKSYQAKDAFCDKEGNINTEMPRSLWNNMFSEGGSSATVSIEIEYEKLEDLEKYIEMGFKEGFIAAMTNLDEIFAKKYA